MILVLREFSSTSLLPCIEMFELAFSFLAFELSIETKYASPMDLVFHFGYVPSDEFIK